MALLLAALPLVLWPGLLTNLFDTLQFDGHSHTEVFRPQLLTLQLASDLLIGLAYVAISSTLVYLVYRARAEIPFHWIFLMFGAFIVACGITHFMHVLTLFTPVFWLDGYVKLLTAMVSVGTAIILPPLVPQALRIVAAAREADERKRHLERSNALLGERNREAETFVYTVSHDLRQPLLAIQGMSALATEAMAKGDAEEAAFLLERVQANTARMGGLLDDLLQLSRVGRSDEEHRPLDLGQVVYSVVTDLDGRMRERKVALSLPREWPQVSYVPGEAYQLLANVIGNAVKWAGRELGQPAAAPPVRSPQVRVTWSESAGVVLLRVEDNGPGIASEYREKVFALFQKIDYKSEGTGVGLAIVKRIVERHGGRVWVEDSSLGGAAFVLSLPSAERQEPATAVLLPAAHDLR